MNRYTPTDPHVLGAWEYIGGLSFPSKMPCPSYSIPAIHCQTGGKLRKVPGSTCEKCYAMKGFYGMGVVRNAMDRRYAAVMAALDNPEAYVSAFTTVLQDYAERGGVFFRWHDSGDLQSIDHFELLVRIAAQNPNIMFWLPTREYQHVKLWCDLFPGQIPPNMTVRLSSPMIGQPSPPVPDGCVSSEVHVRGTEHPRAYGCEAYSRGGVCGDCRACWTQQPVISYPLH